MKKKLANKELEDKVEISKIEKADRKSAMDSLFREENKIEKITQSIGAGVVLISKDYKTIWANEVILEIFGDVENKPCYSTFNKRDQVCPGCGVREVFQTGAKRVVHEQKGKDINGHVIWSQIIATPVCDNKGNIESVLEVVMPITERKLAEKGLKESEYKYKTLSENSRVGIWHITVEGYTEYINPSMCSMIEIESIKDLEGRTYHQFFTPESLDTMSREHAKRPENIASSYEAVIVSRKGKKRTVIVSGAPLFDEEGKLESLIGTFVDITERKHAEEQLKRYREQLEEIVDKRTTEIKKINEALKQEIAERKIAEKSLLNSENMLRKRAKELEESNIALKVLLKQRNNDKTEMEGKILSNVKHLISPYIVKLKKNMSVSEDLTYLNILESNLNEIISPFSARLWSKYLGFTPREIQICDLIKDGKQDKDIMEILNISQTTVKTHRQNIRKKLGIYSKRTSLREHLLSLTK